MLSVPERGYKSSDNANVGEVEYGPPAEVDEVHYIPVTQNVGEITRGPAQCAAEPDNFNRPLEPASRRAKPEYGSQGDEPDQSQHSPTHGATVKAGAMNDMPDLKKLAPHDCAAEHMGLYCHLRRSVEKEHQATGNKYCQQQITPIGKIACLHQLGGAVKAVVQLANYSSWLGIALRLIRSGHRQHRRRVEVKGFSSHEVNG